MRAAAARTDGKISSGRWYQLESGIQKAGGQEIPISTRPETVVAAALAVKWDVNEALATAGFDALDNPPLIERSPLEAASDDELLAEIRRRMRGERHDLEAAPQPAAPPQVHEDQEAGSDGSKPFGGARWYPPGQESGEGATEEAD